MKAHAVVPAAVGAERLVGWVLCHDVRDAEGRVLGHKGALLDAATADRLAAAVATEVHLLEMEAGDLHEVPAGERLGRAAAGAEVALRAAGGGQWSLLAGRRGILAVTVPALAAVNALEGISVYTLYDGQVVDAGEVVARAKVTPLVIPDGVVREAEALSRRAGGLVAVRGFRPLGVSAVAPAGLAPGGRARFEAVLREKLDWLGAPLVTLAYATPDAAALAAAVADGIAAGARIVVAAGANALDPLDPVFVAIERLGGRFVRKGVPAHPGSLLWVALVGGVPVLGMPGCGMFSQATLFDLLLPRLLAGEAVDATALAAYGHGGLLGRDMAFRFPPYRAGQDRGAVPE
ncbi:MAG TPA: hypothetical protein VFC42_09330 [Methylomirabilota bacterium]|nr:hypothetical protein [Methylomirabilota bacterium]